MRSTSPSSSSSFLTGSKLLLLIPFFLVTAVAQTTTGPGVPRYFNYTSPPGIGDSTGEPSIGVNWKTEKSFSNSMFTIPNGGTELFFGGFSPALLRVTFNDCTSPASALWEPKPLVLANAPRAAGDPILFTDHETGRTLVSQLVGLTPAGSTTDITDDDGNTFTPSEGSGLPSSVDHQTIGGGPFAPPLTGSDPLYKNAVYYASQDVTDATISLSVDGGRTFGPGVPMFTIADCDGLHGHIKVSPKDGTVYVPDKGCGGPAPLVLGNEQAAVVVSENNGSTWAIRPIPHPTQKGRENDNLTKGDDDPSVGVATDGTIYLGYQSLDGHPRIAVSKDKGKTWSLPFDVGTTVVSGAPIVNTTYPAVVAGDPNRAAFAFYGTTTPDDTSRPAGAQFYDEPNFPGVWYLFIASTFDGGQTWTTINVTPGDPVQRGGICGSGTCRNLLDFFDASIDKEGRVVVGYDDGCVTSTCINGGANDYTAKAVIARQTGGKRMFAANDPAEPVLPGAPATSAFLNSAKTVVNLSWPVPDNGGSAITAYNVYRRIGDVGLFVLIGTTTTPSYDDTTFNPSLKNYYHVTAVNAVGEGPYCKDVLPIVAPPPANPCALPGALVINDLNPDGSDNDGGANTPPDPTVNIKQLFVAEPFLGAGVNQLTFTLQVAPSTAASAPPSTQWYIIWQRLSPDADFDRYYVAMKSDASSNLTFEYGKFGVPLDATNPNPNANTPVKLGSADSGSYNIKTGTIVIKLSNSKAENVSAGKSLSKINVRTFLAKPDGGIRSQNIASDITGDGNYTLAGNASCQALAPVASLTASPVRGPAPLTVNFDASKSSDPNVGGSVTSYTFSFGDGTPDVTQSSPTVSHTYNRPASFFATVTVKNAAGTQSVNVASVDIQTAANLLNISTRERVLTGDNVLIGGFIVTGTDPKKVIIRALGPSVPISGNLQDPMLELHDQSGATIASNDNWKETQQSEITATGIPPKDDRESAIVRTLNPGLYTAIVRGKNDTTGIALVEAYDLDLAASSKLANISTRGFVGTGDDIMIGGFVAGGSTAGATKVVFRAIAPSLKNQLANTLTDPTLELYDHNGTKIGANDNWKDSPNAADIQAAGLAPKDDAESAIYFTQFDPGLYTAIVRGKNNGTGNALVEVYNIK